MLLLGLAGASALILGAGDQVLAGEATGMDIKVIKEAASMIPGVPKVRLREATYQQGVAIAPVCRYFRSRARI